jgi:hypothetical protein
VDAGNAIPLPTLDHWQFYGKAQGGPSQVMGVTADRGGNVWVAGGPDGLFLLRAGADHLQQFTTADGLDAYPGVEQAPQRVFSVLSVSGGAAGEVFVGYQGVDGCEDNFFRGSPQKWIYKSGDADRVRLTASGVQVSHYDISSGPNPAASDPTYRTLGREKLCTLYRILYDPVTQTVWFGANHGVALAEVPSGTVIEHTHPSIAAYQTETSDYETLFTGDFWGLATTPQGDLWLGGTNRSALFRWGTGGRDFWASDAWIETAANQLDVWPDAVQSGSRPSTRTEDDISAFALMPNGSLYMGSFVWGLARLDPNGSLHYLCDRRSNHSCSGTGLVDGSVASLARDRWDDSLWVGHSYGGLTRLQPGGNIIPFNGLILGAALVNLPVRDIQVDPSSPTRRVLVAFQSGAIGIYTGD